MSPLFPESHVHSDTNSTSLGSILAMMHSNYAQRLFTHISTTVYSQVLTYTTDRTGALWRERILCTNVETVAKGDSNTFFRVRRSTADLPRSINNNNNQNIIITLQYIANLIKLLCVRKVEQRSVALKIWFTIQLLPLNKIT